MSYRIEERGRAVKTIVSDRKEVGLEGGKGPLLIRDPMLSSARGRMRGGEQFQGYDHNLDDM